MKWFIIITVILYSCTTTSHIDIQEDVMFVTRKYVGRYTEHRCVNLGWRYPNTCWIKTSLDTIMGKIPVASKKVNYESGEMLYLKRVYFTIAGSTGGFWHYHIESNQSRYTYPIRGNRGATSMHKDVFNINK